MLDKEKEEVLELMHSCIPEFPEKILQMTWLTRLVLTNNRISSLPPDIDKLVNLRELVLAQNQLSLLPITIGYLSEVFPQIFILRLFIIDFSYAFSILKETFCESCRIL